ncbi:toxin-antitoxin system YwqK family antitoxin [Dokdonia sp. PRO95]|uniref:toxin-antitoxin system YwqK family antitoxin n=1 Tax=unclassified Dokdonia TaxID=2615033 RepID=UPI00054E1666|nr:toxin-antitoxin system YwqK family antitoxin [Dokdonia sp. PRO95]
MTRLTILLVILVAQYQQLSMAQSYNQYDDEGKRHGQWQKFFDGSKQLRYTGTFDHGKEQGTFNFYDIKGGHPTAVKIYTPDSPHIDVTFFTTDGKIVSKGKMNGRERLGEWLSYHQDGKSIMIKERYVNGKLEGERMVYFINGLLAQQEFYKRGLKEGKTIYYSEEKKVLKELQYKNDQLEGPVRLYNGFGQLEIEGAYKNNRKHGLWKYYKNGTVDKEIKYPRNKIGVQ